MRPLQDGFSTDGLPHGTQMPQVSVGPQTVGFRQQDLLPQHQQDPREARFGSFSFADRAQVDAHSPVRPMPILPPHPAAGSGPAAAFVAPAVLASSATAGMMRQHSSKNTRIQLSPHTSHATRYMPNPMMTPDAFAAFGFVTPVLDPAHHF